jgi:Terpene cyclase DEP1
MKTRRITGLARCYGVLALLGLLGTWWFNIQAIRQGQDYLPGWFANPAASSAAVDLLIVATAANILMIVEGRRVGMRRVWLLIPLGLLVAVACAFPLFLAWRDWHLSQRPD